MSCLHPRLMIPFGVLASGKPNYRMISRLEEKKFTDAPGAVRVPCGQCIGCRLDYSRQWADRMMLELQDHDSAYFVTLTYDDAHVPVNYVSDDKTGEAVPKQTLRKRDVQLWMKRLRKHFPDDHIRFFACGEYGDNTFRPHYHAILFGLHLSDLVLYKRSGQNFCYYNSEAFSRTWLDSGGNPLGFAVVADVSWETCAYVGRYVVKKHKGLDRHFYEDQGIEPEFVLMSRKPGIGRAFYESHKDLYRYDSINISTPQGGRKILPPRYFDKLYDLEAPEEMAQIKEKRRFFAEQREKGLKTDLSDEWYQEVKENNLLARTKALRREL